MRKRNIHIQFWLDKKEAEAENITTEQIITDILNNVIVP